MEFMDVIKMRRSVYDLAKESSVSDDRLLEMIGEVVTATPSAFNMQDARIVVLLGEEHNYLWGHIVMETLRKIVPEGKFGRTEEKITGFAKAYGTVMFFEDTKVVQEQVDQFPSYKDTFPLWAQHGNGMLQGNLWNMFASLGLGASLQHYNPIIDDEVKAKWKLPDWWKLIAQMPFGKTLSIPEIKPKLPVSERMKVFR